MISVSSPLLGNTHTPLSVQRAVCSVQRIAFLSKCTFFCNRYAAKSHLALRFASLSLLCVHLHFYGIHFKERFWFCFSVFGGPLVFRLSLFISKYENVNLEAFTEEEQPTLYHWVDR